MCTYLGLIMCRIVPAMARITKRAADATYAQPRKGFLPPIHDTVEITMLFVPLYGFTGKSGAPISTGDQSGTPSTTRTHADNNVVRPGNELVVVVP